MFYLLLKVTMSKVDCKVVLLGSSAVGKTCLLERYIHGHFVGNTTAVSLSLSLSLSLS